MLARALEDNIFKFEQKNGEIKLDNQGPGGFPGFQPGNPKIN
jgi:hypothetical protein